MHNTNISCTKTAISNFYRWALKRKQNVRSKYIIANRTVWFIKGTKQKFIQAYEYESKADLVILQGSVEITRLHEQASKIWPCNSKGGLYTQCLEVTTVCLHKMLDSDYLQSCRWKLQQDQPSSESMLWRQQLHICIELWIWTQFHPPII